MSWISFFSGRKVSGGESRSGLLMQVMEDGVLGRAENASLNGDLLVRKPSAK
jgi:hypothetical protein